MTDEANAPAGAIIEGGTVRIAPSTAPLEALKARLAAPLAREDIRAQDGKEYVSGGDVLFNLWHDVGALEYETRVKRLDWTTPRYEEVDVIDKRTQRPVTDKATGEVEKRGGYSCNAVCIVRVILHLPHSLFAGSVKRKREGVGSASSFMQGDPETAIENATKAAETDAIKRACVGLGPRYGLALRFRDRDDDRVGMGLIARNEKLEAARAAREAAKTPAPAASIPEGKTGATPAGNVPAGASTATGEKAVATPEKRELVTLGAKLSDADLRMKVGAAILMAKDAAACAKIKTRLEQLLTEQIGGKPGAERTTGELIAMIADGRARDAATAAMHATKDVAKWDVIRRRVLATLIKQQLPAVCADRDSVSPRVCDKPTGHVGDHDDSQMPTGAMTRTETAKPDPTPTTATSSPSVPSSPETALASLPSGSSTDSSTSTASPAASNEAVSSPPSAPLPSTTQSSGSSPSAPEDRRLVDAPAEEWSRGGPDPSRVGEPQPKIPGHGTVYGAKADEVRAALHTPVAQETGTSVAVEGGGVDDRDAEEFRAALLKALVKGVKLDNTEVFELPDPTADALVAVGWDLVAPSGHAARALCFLKPGDQVPLPMQEAVVGKVKELMGRDSLYALWKQLGMPLNKALPIAQHVRLLAYVAAARKQAEFERAVRE